MPLGGPIPPEQIRAALAAASGPEDLDRRLAALWSRQIGGEDGAAYRELVERALFAADVLGYVNAERGRD